MSLDNIEDAFRLTPAQQGMLYHTLNSPESDVYMAYVVMSLTGKLDVVRLQEAWDAVFQRYDALRASFLWDGLDEPLQVIHSDCKISWQIELRQSGDAAPTDADIELAVLRERKLGMVLSEAPLSRMRLIQTSEQHWTLIWVVHHIVVDGWCTPIILSDVLSHYSALAKGRMHGIEKTRRFSEHVDWLSRQDFPAARAYWRDYLSPVSCTPLRLRAANSADQGGQSTFGMPLHEVTLSGEETARIKDFCRMNRVTLSTLVHCAWALVLTQYTDSQKPLFGTTTSGRQSGIAGVEQAVGLYLNTLPVYIEIDNRPLLSLMQDFQGRMQQNNQFEYMSLAEIQKLVAREHGQPLFESIVVLESHSGDDVHQTPGGELLISDINYVTHSNFPLALLVVPGNQLLFRLVFNHQKFEQSPVADMLRLFVSMMNKICLTPVDSSADVVAATVGRNLFLDQCIGKTSVISDFDSIHQWFEDTCDANRQKVAVTCEGQSWTFSQLDQRANQIARLIRRAERTDDKLIGILLPRGHQQIAAVLGTLKAGKAYVPLNPEHPESRIADIVADAGIRHLVCSTSLSMQIPGVQLLPVEHSVSESRERVTDVHVNPESLAYVMYTSGSTGAPKGVMVTHSNVNYSTWSRIHYYRWQSPVFLMLSAMTFDSSVAGIYGSLCGGGTLVLPAPEEEKDLERIGTLIEHYQVTHTLCLPSVYSLMLRYIDKTKRQSLACVIVAGESCPLTVVEEHVRGASSCRLYNEYGPTEATVWCTAAELTPNPSAGVSIGRPIGNSLVLVLTDSGRLCPPGVEGEIFIGGEGVAAGYHRQPELTAERFIDNPVNGEQYPVLFRTGDLGYWTSQTMLHFAGRTDRQLKIRGVRVEPAEIESVLSAHPGVSDVAVAGRRMTSDAASRQRTADSGKARLLEDLHALPVATAERFLSQVETEFPVPSAIRIDPIPQENSDV